AAGTALRALRTLGAIVGRRVLVTGASGGVGRLAVQIARRAGAYVVALTSSDAKRKELTEIGADEVVTDLAKLAAPLYGVIDTVGGQALVDAWGHLRAGGMLISIGYAGGTPATFPPYSTVGPRKTLVAFTLGTALLPDETLGEDFTYLAQLVARKELDPEIVWRGDWTQLPEAIALLASRKISGKAVLRIPPG
ncbi:MAG TPA: zinc-binding dehydrogenase, partial [Candidatus Binatia bacterium]|nr:zinc-binding dehydrogenase [Candidatus Binatia bacterium]